MARGLLVPRCDCLLFGRALGGGRLGSSNLFIFGVKEHIWATTWSWRSLSCYLRMSASSRCLSNRASGPALSTPSWSLFCNACLARFYDLSDIYGLKLGSALAGFGLSKFRILFRCSTGNYYKMIKKISILNLKYNLPLKELPRFQWTHLYPGFQHKFPSRSGVASKLAALRLAPARDLCRQPIFCYSYWHLADQISTITYT